MMQHEFDTNLEAAVACVKEHFSGWNGAEFFFQFSHGFAIDELFDEAPQTMPLSDLPSMPDFHTPDRHHPVLLYGRCQGVPILVGFGHRHLFEGLGPIPCILPTCVAWRLGIRRHVYVEPVISLLSDLKIGTWTLLTDFINGHHLSPMDGLLHLMEDPFADMSHALSQPLNSEFVNALSRVSVDVHLCVYQAHAGAHFCTPAEAVAARACKADVIGHDLVMEIITAHALKCQVSAFGLVVSPSPKEGGQPLSRRAMLDNCAYCSETLIRGLKLAVPEIVTMDDPFRAAKLPDSQADELLYRSYQQKSGKEPKLKKFLKIRRDDLQS